MKMSWFGLLLVLADSFFLAQNVPLANAQKDSSGKKGDVTVQGCVGRSSGDYVLTKQNPPMTYELQATGKTHLRNYLGQRVEIIGSESPTLSSSSDAMNKTGSAAPVTLTITSIRTIDQQCSERQAQ